MATTLGKSITRNQITGTEKRSQIFFLITEIGESVKYSMGIADPLRTDTTNWAESTI